MSEDSAAVPAPQSVPQAEPLLPLDGGNEPAFADAAPAPAFADAAPANPAVSDFIPAPAFAAPAYGASPATTSPASPATASPAAPTPAGAVAASASTFGAPALGASTGPQAPAPSFGGTVAPTRRRLRWLWWTTGSVFVTALAGLCAYLAVVAHQWSGRVDDLTTISQDLGKRVADQTAAKQTADAKVSTLQSQLDASNARLTDLANEEANAVDHEAVWINLVDSMISCADERQNLIDALTTPNSYFLDGKSKAQVENEITTYCDGLKSDYTTYKAEIGK